jgi:hypothetical protein
VDNIPLKRVNDPVFSEKFLNTGENSMVAGYPAAQARFEISVGLALPRLTRPAYLP